jgi:hypothetical protein
MREEEMIVFLAMIAAIAVVPVCWIVAHYCYITCKHWQATRLVRDMVSRGYSTDEILSICQVLGHRPRRPSRHRGCDIPPAKPVRQAAYA